MWTGRIFSVLALVFLSSPAAAGSYGDNYWGGIDTQNVSNKDVIGSSSTFNVSYVDVSRTNGGNTLKIVLHTGYAGAPGTSAALGTTYGSLFFTSVANYSPIGTAAGHYANDYYQPNDWTWAFVTSATPGTGGLYQIGAVQQEVDYKTTHVAQYYKTLDGKIIMSNAYGDPVTAPYSGNNGYYFRQGQAVQFTPDAGQKALYGGSWSVVSGSTITYYINDQHTLGDTFAMSWAMTCANDVFQRVVSVPGPVVGAGLPGLLVVMAGFCGVFLRQRRLQASGLAVH
ncbi:hypothetical protein [Bradyrhizobium guangxiense]|uniref:hypothetical protein n=1 Tax=Bradyrhizobium guangxiense TaxID=1325115 RepID=UPI0010092524|nr:hypothetical protein [Bradyrhizobium guangxiense]